MAEDARQGELLAQRDEENARIEFRSLLSLTGSDIEMAAPDSPTQPPPLKTLEGLLDRHPAVEAAQQEIEAANEGIEVAKSQRYAYPVLKLFRDREVSATGEVVPVNGIGISVEVPLWNRNRTPENKARAEVDASAARLQKVRRDTRTRLELSYAQLSRQLELAERMHRNLVEPARRMFELTQRSFAAGESNILALVDANNVYFDARARYLDLLHDAWFEAAKLRLASGVSVINPSMETLP